MAIIAAKNSNIDLENILKTIPKLKSVNGRLERICKIKNKSIVILDYSHTIHYTCHSFLFAHFL